MAIKTGKPVQLVDIGTYSIKYGIFKVDKDSGELVATKKSVFRIPSSYSGADLYMEGLGPVLKEISDKLDKKLPIRFSFSSLFAPTNLAYLTRIDKDQTQTRIKEELEKFAGQEKIPPENEHNRYYELFTKEIEGKVQVIAATLLLNPKYVGMLKNHLYALGLKFGGIYPLLHSSNELYKRVIELKPEWKEEALVFVDIGHMTTKVNLFFQGDLLFNKVLHYGAKSFYDELFDFSTKSGDSALSPSEVDAILQKVGFSGTADLVNQMDFNINDPAPYLNNLEGTLKSIFNKVNSSVNYFTSALARNFTKDNTGFMTIRKGATHVILSGGIVNAPSFFEKAKSSFPGQIHILNPFDLKGTIAQDNDSFAKEDLKMSLRENSYYSDLAGAAFISLESQKNNLNMVNRVDSENENILQMIRKLPLQKYRSALGVILGVLILKTAWNTFFTYTKHSSLNKQIRTLTQKLAPVNDIRNTYFKNRESHVFNLAKYQYIVSHMKNYVYWPGILKNLMQKLGSDIKLTKLEFISANPGFDTNKYKKWKESQSENDFPWSGKIIEFQLHGDALNRNSVPNLIQTLKETGIFDIPKPPNTKFVPEQEKIKKNRKNQEEIEIIAAHYTFSLQGYLKLDNPI